MPSTRHAIAALTDSLRSLRWIPFCAAGRHRPFLVVEVWGWRRFCMRCGETLACEKRVA